jgi:hypothetical protein
MESDLAYEQLEGLFTYQNMQVEVHIDNFSKIMSRALI